MLPEGVLSNLTVVEFGSHRHNSPSLCDGIGGPGCPIPTQLSRMRGAVTQRSTLHPLVSLRFPRECPHKYVHYMGNEESVRP